MRISFLVNFKLALKMLSWRGYASLWTTSIHNEGSNFVHFEMVITHENTWRYYSNLRKFSFIFFFSSFSLRCSRIALALASSCMREKKGIMPLFIFPVLYFDYEQIKSTSDFPKIKFFIWLFGYVIISIPLSLSLYVYMLCIISILFFFKLHTILFNFSRFYFVIRS